MKWTITGDVTLRGRSIRKWTFVSCVLTCVACGSQASDKYLGEALLSMQGHAKVTSSTGGIPIVPALCFFGKPDRNSSSYDLSVLPADVREDFFGRSTSSSEGTGEPDDFPIRDLRTYILDVDSQGEFPSAFNVDVYLPPPDDVLQPLYSGEPRIASGYICAAYEGHAEVTHLIQHIEQTGCEDSNDSSTCWRGELWFVPDSNRFYTERYECPPGIENAGEMNGDQCTTLASSAGDSTLLYQSWSESVVGAAEDPEVLYLAEPAPAGSYTAYRYGAPEGLSAGYHLYPLTEFSRGLYGTREFFLEGECNSSVQAQALVEFQERYGDQYKIWLHPFISIRDESGDVTDDALYDALKQILARLQMQACEIPEREEMSPDDLDISLDVNTVDPYFTSGSPVTS